MWDLVLSVVPGIPWGSGNISQIKRYYLTGKNHKRVVFMPVFCIVLKTTAVFLGNMALVNPADTAARGNTWAKAHEDPANCKRLSTLNHHLSLKKKNPGVVFHFSVTLMRSILKC